MRLIFRSTENGGGGGGSGFSPVAGYSYSGTFGNGSTDFTLTKSGGGFGTGPTIALFADFRGGTVNADVGLSQTVGAFTSMVTSGSGSSTQKPYYMSGARDGSTCMSTMSDALGAENRWASAILSGLSDFTQFYCARAVYGDFTDSSQNNSNQKDVWVNRKGEIAGAGHDVYQGAFRGIFSNSSIPPPFYYDGSSTADAPYASQPLPNEGYYPRNEWTFNEWGVRPHTTAAVDALMDAFGTYCNVTYGWERSSSTGLVQCWGTPATTAAWNHVFFQGDYQDRPGSTHGVTAPYLTYYKWDDLYFAVGANSWKRFLLGDASTLAACTKLYIIPHDTWADGSIRFLPVYTEWPDWSGKHLHWIDNTYFTATRVGSGS